MFAANRLSLVTVIPATKIEPTPFDRQVERAAIIACGRVESVTISDNAGLALDDVTTKPGPGEPNALRARCARRQARVKGLGSYPES